MAYTKDQIQNFATTLRNALKISENTRNIDMQDVLEKANIELLVDGTLTTDGKVERSSDNENNYQIYLPRNYNEENVRDKFTLGHELGHIVLNFLNDESNENSQESYNREGRSQTEYDANEFAASFLMPRRLFKKVADENYDSNKESYDVVKIADEFGVSTDAVVTRGKFLGIFAW